MTERSDPFADWSDYRKGMNGIRTEGCTCHLLRGVQYEGGQAISPAEWEQADDCPIHPLSTEAAAGSLKPKEQ